MSAEENNSEIKLENTTSRENREDDARVYEVGYLLLPTLSEEEVPRAYGNLKEFVTGLGGEVISDDMPRITNLAYTMSKVISNVRNKFNSAYFGWTKFYMTTEKIVELKKKLDLEPTMLRFLITKTVKENTIAAKRFVPRTMWHPKPTAKKEGDEPAAPINKEEIDKEIDAMVAVQ